ncbi:MAG: hypothetical protein ABIF09_13950 [Gemmatimonadota bacterium]
MEVDRRVPAPIHISRRSSAAAVLLPGLFFGLGLSAACDVTLDYLRRDLQEQRLEEIGLSNVDPSGQTSSAGVSILRDLDIRPLNTRRIGSDTTSRGFHRYVHRCGTCHSAPDPSLRTASQWKYVFPRMEKHLGETGLIPLGPMDRTLILEFLGRHAAAK